MSNNDIEADTDPVSTNNIGADDPEQNNDKTNSENHKNTTSESNNNDQHVQLPKKQKVWFFFSYSTFLISYLIFVLVVAYTYPLKPVCNVHNLYFPAFDDKLSYITEQQKESVSLVLHFINRNPLISFSYDDFLNITIYYRRSSGSLIYVANATVPGFYQHNREHKKFKVKEHAPGVRGLLQLQKETSTVFLVELVFSVRFECRGSCKHKDLLLMNLNIQYNY